MKKEADFKENNGYVKDSRYSQAPHVKSELEMMIQAYSRRGIKADGRNVLSVDISNSNNEIGWFLLPILDGLEVMHLVDNRQTIIDRECALKTRIAYAGRSLNILQNDADYRVRMVVVDSGYNAEKFIRDRHFMVRAAVANKGVGLSVLVSDPDFRVRQQVAYRGFGLDVLMKDEEASVRSVVAHMGYGHDILVKDDSNDVKFAIAMYGNKLDTLITDKCVGVRMAVACNGYGLDKLVKDRSKKVSALAQEVLRLQQAGQPIDKQYLHRQFSKPAPKKK